MKPTMNSLDLKLQEMAGRIRDLREIEGLTESYMAEETGVSLEEYRACKAALFRPCRRAVGNMDDPAWPHMAVQRPPSAPVSSFGFDDRADVRALAIEPDPDRPLALRLTAAGAPRYHIPLPGRFNGLDALAAVALARALGLNDGEDLCHTGFDAFNGLMDKYKPRYFVHGHIHMTYGQDIPRLSSYGDTQVINAYESYTFDY